MVYNDGCYETAPKLSLCLLQIRVKNANLDLIFSLLHNAASTSPNLLLSEALLAVNCLPTNTMANQASMLREQHHKSVLSQASAQLQGARKRAMHMQYPFIQQLQHQQPLPSGLGQHPLMYGHEPSLALHAQRHYPSYPATMLPTTRDGPHMLRPNGADNSLSTAAAAMTAPSEFNPESGTNAITSISKSSGTIIPPTQQHQPEKPQQTMSEHHVASYTTDEDMTDLDSSTGSDFGQGKRYLRTEQASVDTSSLPSIDFLTVPRSEPASPRGTVQQRAT